LKITFKYFCSLVFSFFLFISSLIINSCASSVRYTEKETVENKSYNKRSYSNLEQRYAHRKSIETRIEVASYYADEFNGKRTANGEIYNMYGYTAAHVNYPFNTIVRVSNLSNNRTVIVRINDRKPDTNGRAIDLSLRAAHQLRMISSGIANVKIEVLEWGDR
jgi:rare lipoprotein A